MTDPAARKQSHDRPLPKPPEKLFGSGPPSREQVASYLLANRGMVRRRVLGKLRQAGHSGIDPDDLLSTVIRRTDLAFLRDLLKPDSDAEFWAYVLAIADNATLNRIRDELLRRSAPLDAAMLANSTSVANDHAGSRSEAAAAEVHQLLMELPFEQDRELLLWKARGVSYGAIATATQTPAPVLRQRWSRLVHSLRAADLPGCS